MLDALTIECHQVFLYLTYAFRGFLIQRNANATVRSSQSFGYQARVLAFDVEVADFAKIEKAFVVIRPEIHASAVHVVGEVIDFIESTAFRFAINAVKEFEIDVVDRIALGVTVNKIQGRATNPLDGRKS